ncbi:MAG: DUF4412 domain-containing protein, partial [Gemmatimonadaceae bacterium]
NARGNRSIFGSGAQGHQIGHCLMKRAACFAFVMSLMLSAALTSVAEAQRFEGVVTMHLNQSRGRGGSARGGPVDANAAGARGDIGRGGRAVFAGDSGRGGRAGRGDPNGRGFARGADGRGGDGGRAGGGVPPGAMAAAQNMRFTMPSEIEYMTRRGKVRVSLGGTGPNAPGAIIYAPEEGMVYTLIPSASMYMQNAISELNAPTAVTSDSGPITRRTAIARTPVITHTKKFELIAGHRCEHIIVQVGTQKTDICMAKGMGEFIMPSVLGNNPAWTLATDATNGFPLKVIGNDGIVMMEVTKVERKALAESLFNVPESYTKMGDPRQRPPGE